MTLDSSGWINQTILSHLIDLNFKPKYDKCDGPEMNTIKDTTLFTIIRISIWLMNWWGKGRSSARLSLKIVRLDPTRFFSGQTVTDKSVGPSGYRHSPVPKGPIRPRAGRVPLPQSAGKIFNTSNPSPSSLTTRPVHQHFSTVQHFSPPLMSPWLHNETTTRHRRMATQTLSRWPATNFPLVADEFWLLLAWWRNCWLQPPYRLLQHKHSFHSLLYNTTQTRNESDSRADLGTDPRLPRMPQRLHGLAARHLFSSGDEKQGCRDSCREGRQDGVLLTFLCKESWWLAADNVAKSHH
jgi:hypothetical protein